jgi:histidinol-phosphate phosphatase family protein
VIARLNAAGCQAIVVTNQRGVALGRMSREDLDTVHGRLEAELARVGARPDGIYARTHDEGACNCRKPAIGLFERARSDALGIEYPDGVVIGDSWRDMEAASVLGCGRRVLLADPAWPSGHAGLAVDHVAASPVGGRMGPRPVLRDLARGWGTPADVERWHCHPKRDPMGAPCRWREDGGASPCGGLC